MFDWYSDSNSGLGGTVNDRDNFSRESRTEKDYDDMSKWAVNKSKSGQNVSFRGDTEETLERANRPSFWDIF